MSSSTTTNLSPLESFLRDYADTAGGAWDEIEPQVYDLMLPRGAPDDPLREGLDPDILRVAFDPEAIPEHPGSQLASLGTPLVNRLLAEALERGRTAELYYVGLNAVPQGLPALVRRAFWLPEEARPRLGSPRVLDFPQAVFWFEATFASDQKEQELLPVAIDVHYGRQVRHLDRLLDRTHLAEEPAEPLPEVRHRGLASAYPLARDRVVRTVAALANSRARELAERLDRQVERMQRYYADLRSEVDEQAKRATQREDDPPKFAARRQALEREERLRIAELRQKSALKVDLRLVSRLVVHQPKLAVPVVAQAPKTGVETRLTIVWDPVAEAFEAADCPGCQQPTFEFALDRAGRLNCPACAGTKPARR